MGKKWLDSEEELLTNLGQALHKNSFFDEARKWGSPEEEQAYRDKGLEVSKYFVSEETKELWKWMANRFVKEIAPTFKIKIVSED